MDTNNDTHFYHQPIPIPPSKFYRQSIICSHSVPNLNLSLDLIPRIRHPRKLFCGCGAKAWAFAIAGLQIFFFVSTVILSLSTTESIHKSDLNIPGFNDTLEAYGKYTHIVFDPAFQLFQGFVCLVLGCALLAGVHYKKPLILVGWLIVWGMGVLMVSVLLIILVLWLFFMGGGQVVIVLIFIVLIPFGIQVFSFHVVYIHQRELSHLEIQNEKKRKRRRNALQTEHLNLEIGGNKKVFFDM